MKYVKLVGLIAVMCLLVAGCGDPAASAPASPDARGANALASGKADSVYSDCDLQSVVLWANDPHTDATTLKDAGVHTRAARNIIAYRNGPDGQVSTSDDQYFEDAREVDDVYFVGPVAMDQLTAAVSDQCTPESEPTAETIFSPQPYAQSHLMRTRELIDSARDSLDIAMYSFHDDSIFEAIADAVDRGVSVRMLFDGASEDRRHPAGTLSARLEDAGATVRWVNKVMHHKFVIVDGARQRLLDARRATLVSGSANWSYSAGTRYDENTVVISGDVELALRFQREFNLLWGNSRPVDWNDELEYFESMPIKKGMIPDRDGVDATFTSANFRTYYSNRYGNTFGILRGENEVSDRLVELIEGATDSIWIASGHLRSRPVYEALVDKWNHHPHMDIRVYLDNQEYVGKWYHDKQQDELDECLDEAGDSEAQRGDCLDSGFYFSYGVQEAGIPLRFKFYAYRWYYTYAMQMHHKYLIFDGDTVASGSYNLSDNAEHNTMENLVVYKASRYPQLVDDFEANFAKIWQTGRAEGMYDQLVDEIESATAQIPIVFEPMALTWQQVGDLKDLIGHTCPAVYSDPYDDHPEDHKICKIH